MDDGSPPPPAKRTLADILEAIAADETRTRVSVADLLGALQDRAFGALMLIFAIPNALPAIPGTSAILGAPLVFLAAQLAFGRSPWLPRLIADRSMPLADFQVMAGRMIPWIQRAEKLLRPRLTALVRPPAEYGIGILCLLLAVVLFLPIPLGNMLPALAICFFSLALLERDGVWAIVGFLLSGLSALVLVLASKLVLASLDALLRFMEGLFV